MPETHAPTPPPPRRWFQFRLRTLLITVAVLAVPMAWVGHSLQWMRERHAVIRHQYGPNPDFELVHYFLFDTAGLSQPHPYPDAPGLLWLFGEPAVSVVVHEAGASPSREELARLFPEATIIDDTTK